MPLDLMSGEDNRVADENDMLLSERKSNAPSLLDGKAPSFYWNVI